MFIHIKSDPLRISVKSHKQNPQIPKLPFTYKSELKFAIKQQPRGFSCIRILKNSPTSWTWTFLRSYRDIIEERTSLRPR